MAEPSAAEDRDEFISLVAASAGWRCARTEAAPAPAQRAREALTFGAELGPFSMVFKGSGEGGGRASDTHLLLQTKAAVLLVYLSGMERIMRAIGNNTLTLAANCCCS